MCDADQRPTFDGHNGTDKVVLFPQPSRSEANARGANADLLRQVTTALGVPVDYFHRLRSTCVTPQDDAERQADHDAMVAAFETLRDPLVRRQIVKVVQTLASAGD